MDQEEFSVTAKFVQKDGPIIESILSHQTKDSTLENFFAVVKKNFGVNPDIKLQAKLEFLLPYEQLAGNF